MNFTAIIDKHSDKFDTSFNGLTDEQLNWRPNDQTWSIAQNLEHLIIINESYFPIFDQLMAGNFKPPFIGKFNFIAKKFGQMILKSVDPNNLKKSKTFEVWKPNTSQIDGDILSRFLDHQATLKQYIIKLEKGQFLNSVIHSPVNKYIIYTLDDAFKIIVDHESRHFKQATGILNLQNG